MPTISRTSSDFQPFEADDTGLSMMVIAPNFEEPRRSQAMTFIAGALSGTSGRR